MRFHYRLDPLVRLRTAQRDAAQAEVARATREVEARLRESEALGRQIEGAHDAMRAANRRGGVIRADEQLRLRDYLHWQRDLLAAKEREVERLREALARALAALHEMRRSAKALELHRGRVRTQFEQRRQRAAAHDADDRWLGRRVKRPQ